MKEKSLKVPEPVLGKKLKDVDEEEEDDKIKAWKGEKKETKVVTILQEKEAGPELPGADSPASQSEVVTAAFLASLTKNMTPASAGSSESRYILVCFFLNFFFFLE